MELYFAYCFATCVRNTFLGFSGKICTLNDFRSVGWNDGSVGIQVLAAQNMRTRVWSLEPRLKINEAGRGSAGLKSQCWGDGERQTIGAHRPAILSYMMNFKPVRDLVSKNKADDPIGATTKVSLCLPYPYSYMGSCMCVWACERTHIYTYKHKPRKLLRHAIMKTIISFRENKKVVNNKGSTKAFQDPDARPVCWTLSSRWGAR